MGIGLRAGAGADVPGTCGRIACVVHERLVGREAMGEQFKCMALSARDWPRGAGFPEGEQRQAPEAA